MKKISVITSLFRCSRYLEGYLQAVAAISNPDEVEVLLLHNQPTDEELAIIKRYLPSLEHFVQHVHIPEREGLYVTWNRGIRMAKGEYIAVWNVDDVRTPDTLALQAAALDANPSALLAYGQYIGVQEYGTTQGILYDFPEYSQWKFTRSCYLTPFPMWRASAHQSVGYFDEGFRSAGDYDFQIRLAHAAPFAKVSSICGYYLEAPESGISKTGNINNIERTVCELRYGMFDKVDALYIKPALRYALQQMQWDSTLHAVDEHFSGYRSWILRRLPMAPILLSRLPINTARYIKHQVLPRISRYIIQMATKRPFVHVPL